MADGIDQGLIDDTRAFLDEPEARDDPVTLYRRLTTDAPVLPIGDGRTVISGYQEIRSALRSPQVGTSVVGTPWASQTAGGRDDALGVLARAFINEVDGDAHERISRSIQVPWIVDPPDLVDQWSAEVVDEGLASAAADGTLDLVSAIFQPLPAVVISRACALDMADLNRLRGWAAGLGALPMPDSMQPPGWTDAAVQAAIELTPWTEELIAQRRSAGGDDFLSLIIDKAGETLSSDELVAIVAAMVTGGQEGTTASITSAVAQFLAMDGMLDRLRSEPDQIDHAIWEAQRLDGAHRFTLRYTKADVDLAGQQVPEGELLMAFLAAGNRDPAVWPEPDSFDLERQVPGHHRGHGRNLAHSFGEHHCGGTNLGHAMMNAALRRLLERTTSIEAVEDPTHLPHTGNLLFAFIAELPVRVTLREAAVAG